VIVASVAHLPQGYAIPTARGMLLSKQGAPLHMVASGLLKLRRSSSAAGLHSSWGGSSRRQQQVQAEKSAATATFTAAGLCKHKSTPPKKTGRHRPWITEFSSLTSPAKLFRHGMIFPCTRMTGFSTSLWRFRRRQVPKWR